MAGTGSGVRVPVELVDPSIKCKVKTLEEGDGIHSPDAGAMVLIDYEVRLKDGTAVDSASARQQPLEARLGSGELIRGLERTLPTMTVGQRCLVTVPPELAYGTKGFPPIVPGNAELMVDLKLISFEAGRQAAGEGDPGRGGAAQAEEAPSARSGVAEEGRSTTGGGRSEAGADAPGKS